MRAPEFPQNLRWFNLPADSASVAEAISAKENSIGITMKGLRDRKVILIDFWTYSCVNCIRTLPHLKEWHNKYSDKGLIIVGVHTPEFEFEKNVGNVERIIKEFEIEYPVVMDNDYQIWSLYSNNFWPRKFLIDKDGQIVYDHSGEGNYRETEEVIQKTLLELNPKLKLPKIETDASTHSTDSGQAELGTGKVCLPATPETYMGSLRGHSGEIWNFSGVWKTHPEFTEHDRKTESFVDYISLNFEASEVNLVMEAKTEQPIKLRIELDNKFIKDIEVHKAKMYNLLSEQKMLKGVLKIFVKDEGLRAYAFTFGGCT